MAKNPFWNFLNDTHSYFRRMTVMIAGYFLKIPEKKFLSKNITPQGQANVLTPQSLYTK